MCLKGSIGTLSSNYNWWGVFVYSPFLRTCGWSVYNQLGFSAVKVDSSGEPVSRQKKKNTRGLNFSHSYYTVILIGMFSMFWTVPSSTVNQLKWYLVVIQGYAEVRRSMLEANGACGISNRLYFRGVFLWNARVEFRGWCVRAW